MTFKMDCSHSVATSFCVSICLGARLQLVDWAATVASHPQWVPGSDGVHANADGYRNRAALYAQAIRGCTG